MSVNAIMRNIIHAVLIITAFLMIENFILLRKDGFQCHRLKPARATYLDIACRFSYIAHLYKFVSNRMRGS
jgi:hypothetical protein